MRMLNAVLAVLSLAAVANSVSAQEAQPGTVVLDQFGSWRMFSVLKQPEIAFDEGVGSAFFKNTEHYWLNGETPPPPANWTEAEFDDGEWLRGPAGMGCQAPFVKRACFRGRFRLTDPATQGPLTLSLRFHGGTVVYLNGEEIARQHLPVGAGLAESYPPEAFLTPEGSLLVPEGSMVNVDGQVVKAPKPDEEALRRIALRERTLSVGLPVRLLRKGVNVLAIEVVRAPYHKAVDEQKTFRWDKEPMYNLRWNTCELEDVELTSAVPLPATETAGLQAWNGTVLRTDFELDSGDPCEPVRPIAIAGARNGIFSGKLVLGAGTPIRGLKAEPGPLSGPGGAIPASAVQVRYGTPGGAEFGIFEYSYGKGSSDDRRPELASALSVLADVPPDEYAAPRGAVAPVWVTVHVPADAAPGRYAGRLMVTCEGQQSLEVPIELTVADWALPDPANFKTWTEVIQSPDTLQLEYDLPAWSDEHFKLIARSFRLMRQVGSSVVYIPLICCTYYGNEESMVRWVKRADGGYDFDFSVLDKYLDAVQENLGKPKIVCFIVWEVFLLEKASDSLGGSHGDIPGQISRVEGRMSAPFVTTVYPATGQVDRISFPDYCTDPANKALWTKLFQELRVRMEQRGLDDTMMLGWFTDVRAQKEEVAFWNEVTGELPWVSHSHFTLARFMRGQDVGLRAGYNTSVHDTQFPPDPTVKRVYGWQPKPVIHAQQLLRPGWRGEMDRLPGAMWNSMTEITLAGGQCGFGRLGGDTWYVVKDKRGRRVGRVYDRYPWSNWGNLQLCCQLFMPGPEGALPTAHYEQLREGVQACEARIFIEQALTDEAKRQALGDDLAGRCQTALDERLLFELRGVANYVCMPHDYVSPWKWIFQSGEAGHAWYQSTGYQERNARLYALAGEVAKSLGGQ